MTKTTALIALVASLGLAAAQASAQDHAAHGTMQHDHDHAEMAGSAAPDDAASAAPAAEGRTITAQVHGMVCDFCARSLTKVLSRNDAVEEVAVDLTDKTVTIVLKDGADMPDEAVREAVTDAGYNLASLERS